jgi:hypothetical protein
MGLLSENDTAAAAGRQPNTFALGDGVNTTAVA